MYKPSPSWCKIHTHSKLEHNSYAARYQTTCDGTVPYQGTCVVGCATGKPITTWQVDGSWHGSVVKALATLTPGCSTCLFFVAGFAFGCALLRGRCCGQLHSFLALLCYEVSRIQDLHIRIWFVLGFRWQNRWFRQRLICWHSYFQDRLKQGLRSF